MAELESCSRLYKDVISENLCTYCGACIGMCPYFVAYKGRVVLKDICNLSDGRCYAVCPRASVDLDSISKAIYGVPYSWDELGAVKEVFMARSTNTTIKTRAQDAGTVTSLTILALEEGFIDSAVLTHFEDKLLPTVIIASTKGEVLECAGSSYMAVPTIELFNRAIPDRDRKSIGVISTPCQALALAKMQVVYQQRHENLSKIGLVTGLFCTWALSYPDFAYFLKKKVLDRIVKYDIPPHPANVLVAYTEKERIDIPIDEVLPFVMPTCHVCPDLTAEFADISVGSGRGQVSDWNTVVVRTERGMSLIDAAKKKGIIEIQDIPKENLSRLKVAALNKKRRALRNIIQRTGSMNNLLYIKTQPDLIKQLVDWQK